MDVGLEHIGEEAMSDDGDEKPRYLTHQDPIWRDKANYILMAHVEDDLEQLWTQEISESTFMICCIPFFIYDVALGDIVEAVNNRVTRVIERSGRYVFRVWLSPEGELEIVKIVQRLYEHGALVERSSRRMFAIDASNEAVATEIRQVLEKMQAEGLFEYETGWL